MYTHTYIVVSQHYPASGLNEFGIALAIAIGTLEEKREFIEQR